MTHTHTHTPATIGICGSLKLPLCIDIHTDRFSAPTNALITSSQINKWDSGILVLVQHWGVKSFLLDSVKKHQIVQPALMLLFSSSNIIQLPLAWTWFMHFNRQCIEKDYCHGPPDRDPSKTVKMRCKNAIKSLLQSGFLKHPSRLCGLWFFSIFLRHIWIFLAAFCLNWNPDWNSADKANHTSYRRTEFIYGSSSFLYFSFKLYKYIFNSCASNTSTDRKNLVF